MKAVKVPRYQCQIVSYGCDLIGGRECFVALPMSARCFRRCRHQDDASELIVSRK
jgi:hypothetical protein